MITGEKGSFQYRMVWLSGIMVHGGRSTILLRYLCGTPLPPNNSHPIGLAQRTAKKISTDAHAACGARTQIRAQHDP